MLSIPSQVAVFAFTKPVDFRKQHDGLFGIVQNQLKEDPLDGSLYIFLNRRRDRIKILVWDSNGLWLFYKRLEKGTFEMPRGGVDGKLSMTRAKLAMLLDGFAFEKVKKRKHFVDDIGLSRQSETPHADPAQQPRADHRVPATKDCGDGGHHRKAEVSDSRFVEAAFRKEE